MYCIFTQLELIKLFTAETFYFLVGNQSNKAKANYTFSYPVSAILNFCFRKKYNNDDNKVLFLAVSDDNKWIKVQ